MSSIDELLPSRGPEAIRGDILMRSRRLRRRRLTLTTAPVVALAVVLALVLAPGSPSQSLRLAPADDEAGGPGPDDTDDTDDGVLVETPDGSLKIGDPRPAASQLANEVTSSATVPPALNPPTTTTTIATPPPPASARARGPIVFTGDTGLWIMNPDGSGHRALSTKPTATRATVSPDGTQVAYVAQLNDAPSENTVWVNAEEGIFVQAIDGGAPRLLVESPDFFFGTIDWSPDGKRILYESRRTQVPTFPETYEGEAADIGVIDVDGTNQRILRPGAVPRWSPDGRAYVYFDGGWLVAPIDGGEARRLTDRRGPYPQQADWSPDGRLVYNDGASLIIMGADGSSPRTIHTAARDVTSLAWSPDGRAIAFTVQEPETGCPDDGCGTMGTIWSIAPDGRGLGQLTPAYRGAEPAFVPVR